jgi:hypothetical protein
VTDRDKEKDRDWDQEMREVNRLLAKLPEADPNLVGGHAPTLKKPVPAASPAVSPAGPTGSEWLGAWARVTLGLLVGVGMTQWPDPHECGFHLLFYGVGVGAVLAAGLWSSWASWKRRLAVAHVISLLLITWGLMLAAREVLPRIGYAQAPKEWLCR